MFYTPVHVSTFGFRGLKNSALLRHTRSSARSLRASQRKVGARSEGQIGVSKNLRSRNFLQETLSSGPVLSNRFLVSAGVRVSAENQNPDVEFYNPEVQMSASWHPDIKDSSWNQSLVTVAWYMGREHNSEYNPVGCSMYSTYTMVSYWYLHWPANIANVTSRRFFDTTSSMVNK